MAGMRDEDLVVLGGGPAGLAAAAVLRAHGGDPLVLERADGVGRTWLGHYDRLRLHTARSLSGLPGMPLDRSLGRWVPRDDVHAYLVRYAQRERLRVEYGVVAQRIERGQAVGGPEAGRWRVQTTTGPFAARYVVVATGHNRLPVVPAWPGRAEYRGTLLHSSAYRNPEPFKGAVALVVGSGNSGAEIAIDLAAGAAASVDVAVRTAPFILPRTILGIPTQVVGMTNKRSPLWFADHMSLGLQRVVVGDLSAYGLARPARGAATQLRRDHVTPTLDVGFIAALKQGRVRAVGGVTALYADGAVLTDGSSRRYDVIVAATGYAPGLAAGRSPRGARPGRVPGPPGREPRPQASGAVLRRRRQRPQRQPARTGAPCAAHRAAGRAAQARAAAIVIPRFAEGH